MLRKPALCVTLFGALAAGCAAPLDDGAVSDDSTSDTDFGDDATPLIFDIVLTEDSPTWDSRELWSSDAEGRFKCKDGALDVFDGSCTYQAVIEVVAPEAFSEAFASELELYEEAEHSVAQMWLKHPGYDFMKLKVRLGGERGEDVEACCEATAAGYEDCMSNLAPYGPDDNGCAMVPQAEVWQEGFIGPNGSTRNQPAFLMQTERPADEEFWVELARYRWGELGPDLHLQLKVYWD